MASPLLLRRLAILSLVCVAPVALAQVELTEPSCATNGEYYEGPPAPTVPNGHIAWPADDPVWEFDVYRPANRTTVNSSGVEIRNVTYQGRKVFDRASVPVLNVEYDEGGCGCFRDWQTEEASVDIGDDAVITADCGTVREGGRQLRSGIAVSSPGAVVASCETNTDPGNTSPGGDAGDFVGLAVEDYGDELVVTGHSRAGWYRYRMKWHFYSDGRIWPEFSFAAADAVCTETGHRHHAYWRFDFDLEGTPTNDIVREHPGGGEPQAFTSEASRVLGGPSDATFWSVIDEATGMGYEIVPGEEDRLLTVDPYSKTDALVLRYKVDELDDGLTIGGGCAFAFEPFVNGEALQGEDTVFWYRAGALHTAGSPFECDIVGPMLRPIGFNTRVLPGVRGAEFERVHPNPFTGSARTRFRVQTTQEVAVELYDTSGRRVDVLFEGVARADEWQSVLVDGRDLPAGTYVVRLRGEMASGTTRVVLVR